MPVGARLMITGLSVGAMVMTTTWFRMSVGAVVVSTSAPVGHFAEVALALLGWKFFPQFASFLAKLMSLFGGELLDLGSALRAKPLALFGGHLLPVLLCLLGKPRALLGREFLEATAHLGLHLCALLGRKRLHLLAHLEALLTSLFGGHGMPLLGAGNADRGRWGCLCNCHHWQADSCAQQADGHALNEVGLEGGHGNSLKVWVMLKPGDSS